MLDLPHHLKTLAETRPYFHSESDFQHSLAWEIQKSYPDWECRLEIPFRIDGRNREVDILFRTGEALVAIELKYKSKKASLEHGTEKFDLKNQSAQDLARYDFVKDVYRLEDLVSKGLVDSGFAVFLTNESLYWRDTQYIETVDHQFKIYHGKSLSGRAFWGSRAKIGTIRGREAPILISGNYSLEWNEYVPERIAKNSNFRYLLVAIQKKTYPKELP